MLKKKYKRYLSISAIIILVILFIYWIISISTQQLQPEEVKELSNYNNKKSFKIISGIANPIDGDSIKVNFKKEIRLIDIDAPEYSQNCFDEYNKEYACGKVSSHFLKKLIKGKNITCYYQKKDIYQRYLANCYLEEMNINQEMIKNGMAIIYNLKEASQELINLEEQARNNKVGIWRGSFLEPREYRKRIK